jgi:hypothetical protein
MWLADRNYTPEELAIVKEHEYDLFMYNPGFRAMWHNNFEEYFKGLRDEAYWNKREEQREKEIEAEVSYNMMRDPEYASMMHERAMTEEALFGDPDESMLARGRQFEREQMLKDVGEYQTLRKWENDELYKTARDWSMELLESGGKLEQKTKNIHIFRVLTNVLTVSGKIVWGSTDRIDEEIAEEMDDYQWQMDRVGYTLSLTSLKRCLESLGKWKAENPQNRQFDESISQGKLIQQQLLDRLEEIEQKRLKRKFKKPLA